jgi:hypothetical protein
MIVFACAEQVLKAAEGSPHAALTAKNKFIVTTRPLVPARAMSVRVDTGGARVACVG